MLLMCAWCGAIRVDLPGAMLLKKTDSPFLSSHHLSVALLLEMGAHKPLLPPSVLQWCLAGSLQASIAAVSS